MHITMRPHLATSSYRQRARKMKSSYSETNIRQLKLHAALAPRRSVQMARGANGLQRTIEIKKRAVCSVRVKKFTEQKRFQRLSASFTVVGADVVLEQRQ